MKFFFDKRGQAGLTFIGILVSIAILLLLLRYFVFPIGTTSAVKTSLPDEGLKRGEGVVCMQNLRSVRQSIEAWKVGNDGENPLSFDQLPEYRRTPEIFVCAVGKEAYLYDAQTGTVKCPHPGHGSY
ncbi:MAG: hypothetical protein PHX89_09130 [bacterium]|jgi:hypothetical protein|nr:hypothetical protein [bacterium]